eukprot:1593262-Amphidinium_carterae.1
MLSERTARSTRNAGSTPNPAYGYRFVGLLAPVWEDIAEARDNRIPNGFVATALQILHGIDFWTSEYYLFACA